MKAPVSPPPPAVPTDTINILLKAGRFLSFVRLMKATHVDTQLFSQLNSSTDGITIFAPNDNAFSSQVAGAVGSLNDREKLEFVQFHILPRFLSTSDFQTLSNPVKTLAGSDSKFPLTISTGDNSVKISSGLTKTSISNTIYTDKQVAIYEVDRVLVPKDLFPPAPAPPAPAPAKPVAESPVAPKDASDGVIVVSHHNLVLFGVGTYIAALVFTL
uniref:Fasciclin-like arabinogalactan protein 12 n=2 Tax=Populus alba TaxID=43335 RepID=A0A4U5NSA6_POPAL|nr:fasciclin-like arabinogalactan protein 12 [Populus alba]